MYQCFPFEIISEGDIFAIITYYLTATLLRSIAAVKSALRPKY